MSAALMYCNNKFRKALVSTKQNKAIFEAFKALELEIKKLDTQAQIDMYSVTAQFIESMIEEPKDLINPLEVFVLRSESILGGNDGTLTKIGIALGVIAIATAALLTGAGLGLGIGILAGLWQTPLMFMASLLAAESAALMVVSATAATGIGAGLISGFMLFKTPKIKTALNTCIEKIKESQLSENEEFFEEAAEQSQEHHSSSQARAGNQ